MCALGALGLALAPTPTVQAGACAFYASVALELVDPGGPIPLAPDAGPIVVHTIGEERLPAGQRQPDPFARLRVRGPGAPHVTTRMIAPGVHRLEARYRAGRYRVTGIQRGGPVEMVVATPAPLDPPAIASARLVVTSTPAFRGGTTTTRTLEVTLSRPAPAGAWRLLLYPPGSDASRSALHSVEVAAGATTARFVQSAGGRRCGPNLPQGGVPVVGSQVQVAWLRADGRVSPLSNAVPTAGE